jgi:hypothetical protein
MNPTVSLTFYDELQLRVPAAGKRVFDQNIIFAGFDFNLDKKKRWKLEVGVLNQSEFPGNDEPPEADQPYVADGCYFQRSVSYSLKLIVSNVELKVVAMYLSGTS